LVTPTRREPRESATEKIPPGKRRNAETQKTETSDHFDRDFQSFFVLAFLRFSGKGEMVR